MAGTQLPAASCVRDKNTGDIGEHRAIAGLAQADIRGRHGTGRETDEVVRARTSKAR